MSDTADLIARATAWADARPSHRTDVFKELLTAIAAQAQEIELLKCWRFAADALAMKAEDERDAIEAKTIERCAQIALTHSSVWAGSRNFREEIADAIRALRPHD